jgi:hypothetical protein
VVFDGPDHVRALGRGNVFRCLRLGERVQQTTPAAEKLRPRHFPRRGLFHSQTCGPPASDWGDAQLQNCCTLISPAGALVPPPCPPLSGLAASALPRAGAVFMQDWYFSEAVAMFPNARVMATMARRLEAPPVPSLIW